MEKKNPKVLLEPLNHVFVKYPKTTQYIEEDMKKMCDREKLTVEWVFYFRSFWVDACLIV